MQRTFEREHYISYQQITSLSAATALTVPDGVEFALVQPESQAVRWMSTPNTTLSATVGYPLAVGAELELSVAEIKSVKFIEQTASAKLNIVYFGRNVSL